jgi:hypothetical protein
MYMVQDKEKPDLENKRGLNLAAVRPRTVQLTTCNFRVVAQFKA